MTASFKCLTLERARVLRDSAWRGYVGLYKGEFRVFVTFKTVEDYKLWRATV